MPQKIILFLIAIVFFGSLDGQTTQAQRRKRGLLTPPPATEEPAAATETAGANPLTTPQPTANKATGSPAKPAAADSNKSMDLFEMATKNKATEGSATKGEAATGKTSTAKGTSGKDGEKPIPPPEIVNLQSDGINIVAVLFPSPNADDPELAKVIAPMILLHDWGGSMNDLGPLAQYLQSVGHTVIVPDLRGHGRSVTMNNVAQELDHTKFNRAQIATIKRDFEECKKRLIDLNNQGKLNISMLSVLAVGDMCPLATEWTLTDWSYRSVGSIKQGQDVRSLILVSPSKKFQNLSMTQLIRHPLLSGGGPVEIPTLMIYGRDGDSAKDSSTLYRLMERKRPPSTAPDVELRWAQQSLYQLAVPGTADGADLLSPNPALYRFIGMFNFHKVSRNADELPWSSRESKNN